MPGPRLIPRFRKRGCADKVLGYGPIAYWPLFETSGTTARCLTNSAMNGTYTGVTLANALGPDGSRCPFFDGANDWINIYSVALGAAFDGSEGSVLAWARVSASGIWTDGNSHQIIRLYIFDVTNHAIEIIKNANNQVACLRQASGATKAVNVTSLSTTDWMCFMMTWSESGDALKVYFNGSQFGATQTGLAAWTATGLQSSACLIGARTQTPIQSWDGFEAHIALFGRSLTASEVADLSTV